MHDAKRSIDTYLREADQYALLTREETSALFEQYHHGSPEEQRRAKEALINHNLRLVVKIAFRMRLPESVREDAIQEGNQGLIRAVEKFDPSLGYKFSTYAYQWIRVKMDDCRGESASIIHFPADVRKKNQKVSYAYHHLLGRLHERAVTPQRVAESLGMPVSEVHLSRDEHRSAVSLDTGVGKPTSGRANHEPSSEGLYNVIEQENSEEADREILISQVMAHIKALPLQQQEIICRVYGLGGSRESTMTDIAREYRMSRERIRQIFQAGIDKVMWRIQRDEGMAELRKTLNREAASA